LDYGIMTGPSITIHVLKENRRPVGFAPWPDLPTEEPAVEVVPAKKRKKRKKNG
jgi:hypothetical protein